MDRTHPDFKIEQSEVCPLCPRCDMIVRYPHEKLPIPEWCRHCGYDLRFPINPVRNFFHKLFWGFGLHSVKYPLAFCADGYEKLQEMKKAYKT